MDPPGAGARPDQDGQEPVAAGHRDRRANLDEHAAHDRLLVVRFVAGDVTEAEADAARELLSSCPECRLLASDLRRIAPATADLPTPPRTRDFRISPEEAARLRGSALGRWRARLSGGLDGASGRLVPLQRLAAAAVAIGLVMAVVTSPVGVPGLTPGAAAPPSAGRAVSGGEGSASTVGLSPAAAPTAAPAASAARPAAMAAASAAASPGSGAAAAPEGPLAAAAPAVTPGPLTALPPVASHPPTVERSPSAAQSTAPAVSIAAGPEQSAGPERSAAPAVAFGHAPPPVGSGGSAPAGRSPFEAWQAWLLVAAAGLVAFGLLRWRARLE